MSDNNHPRTPTIKPRAAEPPGVRAVPLFPSATEILAALGVEPVAVSHQCDGPAARDRPAITGRVRGLDGDPDDHDRVLVHDDTYYVDGPALRRADPDVVLTQGVCSVCALDGGLARRAVDRLGLDARIVPLDAATLSDVLDNVRQVGAAVDRAVAAADLAADLEARLDAVRAATPDGGPRVAVLDWLDPVRSAGLWVPELIDAAGGTPGLVAAGDRSRRVEPAELRAFDPEVLVAAPCSRGVDAAATELRAAVDRGVLDGLSATESGRLYAMDGRLYMNRHSGRVVDSAERLAAVVHPEAGDLAAGRTRAGTGAGNPDRKGNEDGEPAVRRLAVA